MKGNKQKRLWRAISIGITAAPCPRFNSVDRKWDPNYNNLKMSA